MINFYGTKGIVSWNFFFRNVIEILTNRRYRFLKVSTEKMIDFLNFLLNKTYRFLKFSFGKPIEIVINRIKDIVVLNFSLENLSKLYQTDVIDFLKFLGKKWSIS